MDIKDYTIATFLDNIAAATATPGGGSATAVSGAMGAALAGMVCRLTIGQPRFIETTETTPTLKEALGEAETLRRRLTVLAEADRRAFERVMATYSLPKGTDRERASRQRARQNALWQATLVPLEVAAACAHIIHLISRIIDKINPHTLGDAAAALHLAEAGIQAAQLNIAINLSLLNDPGLAQEIQIDLERILKDLKTAKEKTLAYIVTHSGALASITNTPNQSE